MNTNTTTNDADGFRWLVNDVIADGDSWMIAGLDADILLLAVATPVGQVCRDALVAADALLAVMKDADDADGPALVRKAAIHFCHVCWFG